MKAEEIREIRKLLDEARSLYNLGFNEAFCIHATNSGRDSTGTHYREYQDEAQRILAKIGKSIKKLMILEMAQEQPYSVLESGRNIGGAMWTEIRLGGNEICKCGHRAYWHDWRHGSCEKNNCNCRKFDLAP